MMFATLWILLRIEINWTVRYIGISTLQYFCFGGGGSRYVRNVKGWQRTLTSMIFFTNAMTSGIYSVTRVMTSGGRTPKAFISSRNSCSYLAACSRNIFWSRTLAPFHLSINSERTSLVGPRSYSNVAGSCYIELWICSAKNIVKVKQIYLFGTDTLS